MKVEKAKAEHPRASVQGVPFFILHPSSFVLSGLALVVTVAGCATPARERLVPQRPDLKTIAIAPFFNRSSTIGLDGRQVSEAFYAELQQVDGTQVLPLGVVETAMKQYDLTLAGAEEAMQLASLLDVDAIIIGAVTDYDPYMSPRLGLAIQVYTTGSHRRTKAPSLEHLTTSGRPDRTLGEQDGGQPVIHRTRLFDGGRPEVVDAVRRYAARRAEDERVEGWKSYLARSDDFIRFCCHEMVRDILAKPMAVKTERDDQ